MSRVAVTQVRRLALAIFSAAALVTASTVTPVPTNAAGWTSTPLSTNQDDEAPSAAVDTNGKVHVAFFRKGGLPGIYYTTNASGSWVSTRLAAEGTGPPSLVLHAGKLHIVYARGGGSPGISYLTNAGGTWVKSIVTNAADTAPSLALDPVGKMHLAVTRRTSAGRELRYVTNVTGTWRSELLGSSIQPKIAVAADGRVVVAEAGFARVKTAGTWAGGYLPGLCNPNCSQTPAVSLVTDATGSVRAAYASQDKKDIHLATLGSSGWTVQQVSTRFTCSGFIYGALASDPILAGGSSGSLNMTYLFNVPGLNCGSPSPWGLAFSTNAGGSWIRATAIRDANWNTWPEALAIGPTNRAHILYGLTPFGLFDRTNLSGSWATSQVTSNGDDEKPSLVADANGFLHTTYRHVGVSPGVYYATNRSGSWKTTRISTLAVDQPPSLAVDRLGKAHLAFKRGGDSLAYATNRTGAWVVTTVATGAWTPGGLAVDSNQKAYLAITNATGLWYATNAAGAWARAWIASADVGSPALALDSDRKAHIAWLTAGGLRYGTNRTGTWVLSSIAASNPQDPQIAVDSGRRVHVVWATFPGTTYYRTNRSGSWTTGVAGAGTLPSLALNKYGDARIATRTGTGIRLLKWTTTGWVSSVVTTSESDLDPALAIVPSGLMRIAIDRPSGITLLAN